MVPGHIITEKLFHVRIALAVIFVVNQNRKVLALMITSLSIEGHLSAIWDTVSVAKISIVILILVFSQEPI